MVNTRIGSEGGKERGGGEGGGEGGGGREGGGRGGGGGEEGNKLTFAGNIDILEMITDIKVWSVV